MFTSRGTVIYCLLGKYKNYSKPPKNDRSIASFCKLRFPPAHPFLVISEIQVICDKGRKSDNSNVLTIFASNRKAVYKLARLTFLLQ